MDYLNNNSSQCYQFKLYNLAVQKCFCFHANVFDFGNLLPFAITCTFYIKRKTTLVYCCIKY